MKKIMCFLRIIRIPIFWLLLTLNAIGQEKSKKVDELFKDWNRIDSPGAVVAILEDDKMVYKNAYGMANLEYSIPNTTKTIYHVASISKQFTVFAIAKLEHEGRLSFDDDIRKYIPEFPDFGEKISLFNLASHTSGLREQWRLLEMGGWRLDDVITTDHILTLVKNQKKLNFKPGTQFMYCNTGFTLLAKVVEKVSGMSYAEYTQKNIFDPLKMEDSFFYDDHEKIVKKRAYSYKWEEDKLKKSNLNFSTVGPTSLFTTVEDLSKWAVNFNKLTIGNKGIFSKMSKPTVLNNGDSSSWALGQFVWKHNGLNIITHSGSDAGYRTFLARFPDSQTTIIVFTNASSFSANEKAFQLMDIYLSDRYERSNENTSEKKEPFQHDKTKFIKLPSKTLVSYEGEFWEPNERYKRKIYVKNDTLMYFRSKGNETPLLPISDNEFKMFGDLYDVTVSFDKNEKQDETMKVDIKDQGSIEFMRMSGTKTKEYVGKYMSPELKTEYTLHLNNGNYMLKHKRLGDIQLNQINMNYFTSDNRNFSQIRFIRNKRKKITGFEVSNDGIRNLEFIKDSD